MRKNQVIFRAVILAGYYGPDRPHQSPYMCAALARARADEHITDAEYEHGRKVIRRYMTKLGGRQVNVMRLAINGAAVGDHSMDTWEQGAGRDFYWNWDKRPRKTNNE